MTHDLTTLARALVALPGWRWEAGMLTAWEQRPEHGGHHITFRCSDNAPGRGVFFDTDRGRWEIVGPDLTDAATGGCLLAALGPGYLLGIPCRGLWSIAHLNGTKLHEGPTLAAAVARALVARGYVRRATIGEE